MQYCYKIKSVSEQQTANDFKTDAALRERADVTLGGDKAGEEGSSGNSEELHFCN